MALAVLMSLFAEPQGNFCMESFHSLTLPVSICLLNCRHSVCFHSLRSKLCSLILNDLMGRTFLKLHIFILSLTHLIDATRGIMFSGCLPVCKCVFGQGHSQLSCHWLLILSGSLRMLTQSVYNVFILSSCCIQTMLVEVFLVGECMTLYR